MKVEKEKIQQFKNLFWENLNNLIKKEYIKNLAFYYNYDDKIVEFNEVIKQKERDGETFEVKEVEKIEKENPESLEQFLARKLIEDFILSINEKIITGWERRLKDQVAKASSVYLE